MISLVFAVLIISGPNLDPKDRDAAFELPPEGCLDMDDPRAKNPDDPRRLKYGVKICCLDPADPRAQKPDEERFKKYGIQMCCLKPEHPWAQNPDDPRIKKWGVKMCCLPPEHPWAQNPDDPRMKKFNVELCCIPPEHPWAQNPNDPRIEKFKVKLCCLKPDHPWVKDPNDVRRKQWNVDLCGPDIKALTHQSNLRHFLKEELTEVQLVMMGKDGVKQTQVGRMARAQDLKLDEEKLWYHFVAPSDIKGLTLLTLDTKKDGVQQWLYLPAFGKVRRLGAADLKEQFGATDYIYEDLKRHVPDDYDYLFLEMQGAGPEEAYVFQATPRDDGNARSSPYGKLKVWLRKSDLFIVKVQEFDRGLVPWKELRFEEIVDVGNGAKRSNRIICLDIKRKHQTAVITTSRKINIGSIDPSWMSPSTFHQE